MTPPHPPAAQTGRVPTSADSERLSRQQAAERLADVGYALMTGGKLRVNDQLWLRIPVADEVVLTQSSRASGGRVELMLEFSWPAEATDA